MMLHWMLYASAVGVLFGVAAAALERAAGPRGWPVRGIWAAAMALTVLAPAVAALRVAGVLGVSAGAGAGSGRIGDAQVVGAAGGGLERWIPGTIIPDGWLTAGWTLASAVMLLWLLGAWVLLRRRSQEWVVRRFDGFQVWVSADAGPAVFGVLRSRIVVPGWFVASAPGERRAMLAHEHEHILEADPPLLAGALLLLVALPWNPALWWQWWRLRQAVELDCDRRVLARGIDPRAYSRLLLEINEKVSPQRLAIAALAESPSLLGRRIRAMLTPRNPRWKIAGALSVALAGAAIVAACNVDRPTELRRTAPAEQPTTEPLSTPADGEFAYEAAVLQRSPELINRAEIAERIRRLYPRLLRDASIEGESLFEFVIQADGSVDPRSVKLVSATHEQFGAVGHHIVEAFRFQPGQYRDSDVRVLVRMPVKWEIPD